MRISFDVDDNKLIKKNTFGIVGLGFKGANFSNIEGDNLKVLDKDKDKIRSRLYVHRKKQHKCVKRDSKQR